MHFSGFEKWATKKPDASDGLIDSFDSYPLARSASSHTEGRVLASGVVLFRVPFPVNSGVNIRDARLQWRDRAGFTPASQFIPNDFGTPFRSYILLKEPVDFCGEIITDRNTPVNDLFLLRAVSYKNNTVPTFVTGAHIVERLEFVRLQLGALVVFVQVRVWEVAA